MKILCPVCEVWLVDLIFVEGRVGSSALDAALEGSDLSEKNNSPAHVSM